jgi:hypothetical protein
MLKLGVSGLTLLIVSILFAVCGSISSLSYTSKDARSCPKSRKYDVVNMLVSFMASVIFFVLSVLAMN